MNDIPATPKAYYTTLVEEFGGLPGVATWEKKNFGSSGLSINDKIFAMLLKGELVLKLPKKRVDTLIETQAGERLVMGQRHMKEWITLKPAAEDSWLPLAHEAMEFVASVR